MKISVNLDRFNYTLFKTQEEYNEDPYSDQSYFSNLKARQAGIYNYKGPFSCYSSGPEKFPCILIRGQEIYRRDGPDEITATYIYDFEITENDDDND